MKKDHVEDKVRPMNLALKHFDPISKRLKTQSQVTPTKENQAATTEGKFQQSPHVINANNRLSKLLGQHNQKTDEKNPAVQYPSIKNKMMQ